MRHNWKVRIKQAIPPAVLNACLLRFPSLYGTSFVLYESNVNEHGGVFELLNQLSLVQQLEGDVIECGSSRCGSSILMAKQLAQVDGERTKRVFACDSYEGFDRSELLQERDAGLIAMSDQAFTSTSFDYVRRKIKVLGLQDVVVPVKGFFRDSLPTLSGPFCFALIDCDLKDSLSYSAETVWRRLSPGGRMVFDDYRSYHGARFAIDEFIHKHHDEIAEYGLLNRLYYASKATCSGSSVRE